MDDQELEQIRQVVFEGVKEAIPCCKVFKASEIDSLINVSKVEQKIKGWVLYSIALGISLPSWFAAGYIILKILKVI